MMGPSTRRGTTESCISRDVVLLSLPQALRYAVLLYKSYVTSAPICLSGTLPVLTDCDGRAGLKQWRALSQVGMMLCRQGYADLHPKKLTPGMVSMTIAQ
jgi:hypothetical protein